MNLGDFLIKSGALTQKRWDQALELCHQSGEEVGEILLKKGWVAEEPLVRALSRTVGRPFASRANGLLVVSNKNKLKDFIPVDLCRRHFMVPIFIDDAHFAVASWRVPDMETMENLKILTGKKIEVFLAMKSEITALQEELYDHAH
ncbi:MAG: hypothetical protein HYT79_10745 [Elusimicrobia bacterium]|nr:hypothetical protein [Elusimicrobiota bacterium]